MNKNLALVTRLPEVRPTSTGLHELELELYRRIFESAKDAIAIIDAQGYYLEQNAAHEELLGYTDREINGQTPAIHLGEQGFTNVAAELARTGHFSGELASHTKSGEDIVLELSAFTMHDAHGQVLCHVGVKRNITERRRADEELKARARQQAAVAELGQKALSGMELDELLSVCATRVAEVLDLEFCKILELLPDGKQFLLRAGVGWKPGLVGHATLGAERESQAGYTLRSSAPIVVDDLRTETRFGFALLLHDHQVISGMSVLIAGREHPWGVLGAHTRAHRKFTTDDINFLVSVANVLAAAIDRKRTEEALQETQQRLVLAQRASNSAVWDWDMLSGVIRWSNSSDVYGVPTDSLDSFSRWAELLHPDDRGWVVERVERAIAAHSDFDAEFRTVWPDGSVHWLTCRGQVIYNGTTPVRMVGIAMDVTGRKRAEEMMQRSEKLAMIGRLAASIAHEINNPLESVTNLLYLIEHHQSIAPEARAYAEMAQRELSRVAHIARQTLGFYRESVTPTLVDLEELVDEILRLYARKLEKKNVRVERQYSLKGQVSLFPAEIRQVISNLLMNAFEASPEAGVITVRLSHGTDYSRPEVRGTRIVISDNGHGIPEDVRHKIFEAFFTTKGEKGTGLGLWVSNGIVQKHGGSIRLRSSTAPQHHGTVFSIFLPDPQPSGATCPEAHGEAAA